MQLLTFEIAVLLMLTGVIPSVVNVYLLWEDRYKLGVSWFILSMITGGLWALVYTTFTVIPSPTATLAVANFFWPLIPTAALTMFFLSYEYVFKQPVSRLTVGLLFSPIVVLFVLSWSNPHELVFTSQYYVGRDGYLHFPNFDGPLKVLVTQLYGYLLVLFASGIFVGEVMRTEGIRRKRVVYLLAIFTMLVASTIVKVAELVPVYFDPTSVVYSASGLMFAYSIRRHGLFNSVSIGRDQTFEEVNDAILVIDSDREVTDGNQRSYDVFGEGLIGADIERLVPGYGRAGSTDETEGITLTVDGEERYYQCKVSPIRYGRRSEGEIIVLSDVTELRNKEEELELLIQIFSRVFRHNMRNDFNVIQGYADMVETRANGELSRLARKIDEKASKLLDQAIKARQIEEIFSSAETVSVSLRDLVEDVRSSFDGRSDVVIETVVDDVRVDVNPRFALALHELVHNAVVHHPDAEPVEIEIRSEQAESHVHLAVTDNGDGIPEYELAVLRSAEETTLRHGSGIGLWLIRAAVSRSDGTLSIDSTTAGTSIRIRLQKSTAPRQDPTD